MGGISGEVVTAMHVSPIQYESNAIVVVQDVENVSNIDLDEVAVEAVAGDVRKGRFCIEDVKITARLLIAKPISQVSE